ncbi:uncharacterized protein MYCFIDRAFT_80627 [Pseudocercospora fijiensis CIRAD86]|uniref:Uncharacterized protein n=1 Tax=Pseudocercospora fijiensis (strain CIRAD86) TaxID=383855 RepID=M2ZVP1_PSEFD|nr:uncharacterized protein MYCFIDRAFT_80627 [Pseudocercospora fijiensis CIRAD86]EME83064.1 hypothetical protein MYCFIDRAFT_80627 [Pseudocercospora fijiensis CIRAD86]
MSPVTPNPRTWTLRCKNGRSTILIEVDPLQKMQGVRAELLHAIQETNPSGRFNGQDIPKNPDLIKFGRAIDRNNISLGFVSIDSETAESGAETSGKGKGKGKSAVGTPASVSKGKASLGAIADCPQGAGFKDRDVVAFKFVADHTAPEAGDAVVDIVEQWDVDVPTIEEMYGEDEVQEEGIDMEEG